MFRIVVAAMTTVLVLGCTAGETPEPAAEAPADAYATPSTDGAAPARVAAMQLNCGGESFRVAFEEARAVVVNDDGSSTELSVLPPAPDSPQSTYTNGRLTFIKEGGGDTPTAVRFARGRMALQDCAIAQH